MPNCLPRWNIHIFSNPANFTPRETVYQDTWMRIQAFKAALFIISINWKQPKCSLTGSVVYSFNGTGDRRENELQLWMTYVNFSCVKKSNSWKTAHSTILIKFKNTISFFKSKGMINTTFRSVSLGGRKYRVGKSTEVVKTSCQGSDSSKKIDEVVDFLRNS